VGLQGSNWESFVQGFDGGEGEEEEYTKKYYELGQRVRKELHIDD